MCLCFGYWLLMVVCDYLWFGWRRFSVGGFVIRFDMLLLCDFVLFVWVFVVWFFFVVNVAAVCLIVLGTL